MRTDAEGIHPGNGGGGVTSSPRSYPRPQGCSGQLGIHSYVLAAEKEKQKEQGLSPPELGAVRPYRVHSEPPWRINKYNLGTRLSSHARAIDPEPR